MFFIVHLDKSYSPVNIERLTYLKNLDAVAKNGYYLPKNISDNFRAKIVLSQIWSANGKKVRKLNSADKDAKSLFILAEELIFNDLNHYGKLIYSVELVNQI